MKESSNSSQSPLHQLGQWVGQADKWLGQIVWPIRNANLWVQTRSAFLSAQNPVPIVMLSSLTEAGARVTLDALHYGAVDFLQKPSGTISADLHKVRHELIAKVKMAAKVQVGK